MDKARERRERAAAAGTIATAIFGAGGPPSAGITAALNAPEGKKLREGFGAFGGNAVGTLGGGAVGGLAGHAGFSALGKILGTKNPGIYSKGGMGLGALLGALYLGHQGTKKGMEWLDG